MRIRWVRQHKQLTLVLLVCATMLIITGTVGGLILSDVNTNQFSTIVTTTGQQQHPVVVSPVDLSAPVARENQRSGTTNWKLAPAVNTQYIQGYAGEPSALPGEDIPLYISTIKPITYTLDVYRMGWYAGLGGRLVTSVPKLQSKAQGYWTWRTDMQNCPTCTIDPATHLIDANWATTYTLHVGSDWVSGAYMIKMTATTPGIDAESYIPIVVRSYSLQSAILVSLPTNTYQAYNWWGGYSLYTHFTSANATVPPSAPDHATKVSYNRPYARDAGASDFFNYDYHSVRWLEESAFDVSYTTNVDVAAHPELLKQHQIFLAAGHDEYWTKSMRDGVEAARDSGVSLAFIGANDAYWQSRLEPDATGVPDRTLVCYKVKTGSNLPNEQLKNDPDYPLHRNEVTALWRDPVLNRPENSLVGALYVSLIQSNGPYRPDWVVSPGKLDPLEINTGLKPGEHVAGGILGYEYDGIDPLYKAAEPPDITFLAQSPVQDSHNPGLYHQAVTTYYRAPSGALVFDAGSIWWPWGLDDVTIDPHAADNVDRVAANQAISNLTTNILHAMLIASPPPALNGQPQPTATGGPTPLIHPTPTPTPVALPVPTILP